MNYTKPTRMSIFHFNFSEVIKKIQKIYNTGDLNTFSAKMTPLNPKNSFAPKV